MVLKELAKKVKLKENIDIDTVAISKDRYFPKAYVVDLPLETVPDHVWQDIFERLWRSGRNVWDRKLFVVGDKLRLVTTVENVEDKLDWVRGVVERTNRDVDEYNKEEEARETQLEEEMQKHTVEEDKASIDMIRGTLRKRYGAY